MFAVEKWLARKFLDVLNKPQIFITLPDGTEVFACDSKPETGMRITNRRTLWRLIINPGLM